MSLHSVKAIIFDCDGTIVDSEHSYFLALSKAFNQRGLVLNREAYSAYVGAPLNLDDHFFSHKLNQSEIQTVLNEAMSYYLASQATGLPPIKPTYDFLTSLVQTKDKHGLKIGLASASKKSHILKNLSSLNIVDFFDVIVSGQDDLNDYTDPEGVNKPKPYIYLHTAKLLGVSPSECVAIEDSRTGVTAGVQAGCFTIAIPNYHTENHDLSHAHLKIPSLASISVEKFIEMVHKLKAR